MKKYPPYYVALWILVLLMLLALYHMTGEWECTEWKEKKIITVMEEYDRPPIVEHKKWCVKYEYVRRTGGKEWKKMK